ncbi:hypothetical protein Lal_00043067 [Lupinus albus]|nr:hypothetical protein Lal_00043067 [Lupinus albus]
MIHHQISGLNPGQAVETTKLEYCRGRANALSIPPGSTLTRTNLKGIDGGQHKRWSMWFNSIQSEEPYQGLTWGAFGNADTGGAWSSSARAVRCWVKSHNERNPHRKVRMTSSHHAPYALGDTRATMSGTKDRYPSRAATRLHEAEIASNRMSSIHR